MRKIITIALAVMLVVMFSVPAMAFQVTARSAEMVEHSPCDKAGTVRMTFEETDVTILNSYLVDNVYAEIRVFLGAEEWPGGSPMPNLCKDLKGDVIHTGVPHSGELVLLDRLLPADRAEISDLNLISAPVDAEVYVWGEMGDDVIYVYITSVLPTASFQWTDINQWPWFKFGIYDPLDANEDTSICAQVLNFENPTTLTISNEAIPETLNFTGDNEIGHFKPSDFTARDCVKAEGYITETIQLCELGEIEQEEVCPKYDYCFVVKGDFGTNTTIDVTMRTNGEGCNYDTQQGVYFESIAYYKNGVGPIAIVAPDLYNFEFADCTTPAALECAWEAEHAKHRLDGTFTDDDELMIIVTYSINPDEAVEGTKVRFWYDIAGLPCSALTSGMREAADLVPCGGGAMYFPYVINTGSWETGIVVTNLGSPLSAGDIAAMEATFTLTDYTGAAFTYTKTDFTTGIYVNTLTGLISEAGWVPASGAAWLSVVSNFNVDGYSFLTDGTFGAGTLPRVEGVR